MKKKKLSTFCVRQIDAEREINEETMNICTCVCVCVCLCVFAE